MVVTRGTHWGEEHKAAAAPNSRIHLKEINGIDYEFLSRASLLKLDRAHIAGKGCSGQSFSSTTNEQSQ